MKKKKIVLVYPEIGHHTNDLMPPLSLIYIASAIRELFEITIIDQRIDKNYKEVLKKSLAVEDVLCAGVSSMTGPQLKNGLEIAAHIRACNKKIPIVWGGVHPSLLPDQTIENPLVDIIVIGDGEERFKNLAIALAENKPLDSVDGIVYMRNGKVIHTPSAGQFPLTRLGFPAYDLCDMKQYISAPAWTERKSLPVITSRGCPFRCSYCYNLTFSNRKWNGLPYSQTVDVIEQLMDKYGISGIFLLDDNFFADLKRVRGIAESIIERKLDIHIYNANCRVDSVLRMEPELLVTLKKAGFDQLFIGVESGSDEILSGINKDITVAQVLECNFRLKKGGIKPFFSFMAGFPFEKKRHVIETIRLMQRLVRENHSAIVYKMQIYTPFPGTDLYENLLKTDTSLPQSLSQWAMYHYNRVNVDCFDKKHRNFLETIQIYSTFIDTKLTAEWALPARLAGLVFNILLRLRSRLNFFNFFVEIKILMTLNALRKRKKKNDKTVFQECND